MVSPGLSLALSNSMCSTVPKAMGAQAASRSETPSGTGTVSRAGMVTRSRAKPSMWKPMMPPTFSHRLSRPSRQAGQVPQVRAPYITTLSPGLRPVTSGPTCGDLAGGFRAHHQRQLPLGEGHAAEAPEIEMVERHRLDAHLHLAGAGRRRVGQVGEFELAVGDQA